MRSNHTTQASYAILFFYISHCSILSAQDYGEPVVARESMKLIASDETVDTINAGDLLTVLEESNESYVIVTFRGKRGVVSKAFAAKLAESVEVYDGLIASDGKQGRLYTLRANAWWARGSIERALEDFNRAIELGREDPDGYCHRGLCHAALGDYDDAISDYSVAIDLNPEHEAAYINRATAYMVQRSFGAALRDYSEAIGLNGGKRASTYEQRAVAWKQVGVLDKALADFDRAIELNPESQTALMGRAFLWFQINKHDKAIADFSQAIKINPAEAQAYNNRGFNYQLLGQFERALADFEQAIKIDPDYGLAYQNLAWLLASASDSIRDGKRAVEVASKACQLNNYKDPEDLKALAAAFAEVGAFDKAVGWQEKAAAMLPDAERSREEKIATKYRDQQPYRLLDDDASESNEVESSLASVADHSVEVTLKNGAAQSAVSVYLGETKAPDQRPSAEFTRFQLNAGEEKTVECEHVICYYTGSKWKNIYLVEEGLITFSVQQLGRKTAQWVDAYSPAGDVD